MMLKLILHYWFKLFENILQNAIQGEDYSG